MNDATEVWQGYSLQGEPTDVPVTKQQAAEGALHGASHVWIWRNGSKGKEILLQKRAEGKRTWPGFLDISAAGHISFGDTPLDTAIRETKEEIGLDIDAVDLRFLFEHRQNFTSPDELKADTPLQFTDGEVDAVQWVTVGEFKSLTEGQTGGEQLVPQGQEYFDSLLEGLERFSA